MLQDLMQPQARQWTERAAQKASANRRHILLHSTTFAFLLFSIPQNPKSKPEISDSLQVSDLVLRTVILTHNTIADTPAPFQPGSKPLSASLIPFLDSFCACLFKIKPNNTLLFPLSLLPLSFGSFFHPSAAVTFQHSLACQCQLPQILFTDISVCSWISPSLQASCSSIEPIAHTSPWLPKLLHWQFIANKQLRMQGSKHDIGFWFIYHCFCSTIFKTPNLGHGGEYSGKRSSWRPHVELNSALQAKRVSLNIAPWPCSAT